MTDLSPPRIERIRHELVRRSLTVLRTERLTPRMQRLTLGGDELAGFRSLGFDDHLKLIVPGAGAEPQRRDYTPRRHDAVTGELTIDFALHEAGPATQWALAAKPGDAAQIGGPRGSQVISGPIGHWLLIGDETALPAIGRKIDEPPALPLTALVAVADEAEEQGFAPRPGLWLRWVHRAPARADDPAPLLDALRQTDIAPGTFIWIAAEASVARALRHHLLQERGHPPGWLKASGYWQKGAADSVEHFD